MEAANSWPARPCQDLADPAEQVFNYEQLGRSFGENKRERQDQIAGLRESGSDG